jgi:4-cresol dehydrogenase (hydroxylating) flavoprotein subunit
VATIDFSARKLPPGVDERAFAEAVDALADALGAEHVLTDPHDLLGYRDPYAIVAPEHFAPSAVVRPGSVEEVQAVVRIANDYTLPLWTVSTGRNNAYGGAAPRLPGSVILDLGRMNRILEVNEKFGYALVEPGVSYFDLYAYLQEYDIKLWCDVPDLGWGSVIGNTLDRGVGYTPYGDHLMMQCGMEVVLPDGDLLRTGMGAVPGSTAWQLFPYGFGPVQDPLFTQSNYGIVTKMGIWLMPAPPAYQAYMIAFEREEDLEPFVDILRPLRMNMVVQNVPSVRHVLLDAATIEPKTRYHDGKGPVPDSVIREIMADQDLGFWNFYGALYGPPPIIDAFYGVIRDAFSQIPGARFFKPEDRPGRNGHVLRSRAQIMAGIPNLDELELLKWTGPTGGHIDFSPVSPADGKDAMKQYEMVRDRCLEHGSDYVSTFVIGMREMHHICLMLFDTADPEDRDRTLALCRVLVEDAAKLGYGEYRTHLALMDDIAATFNFNDNAMLRFNERIKDALDPNGIIQPGKSGIWPARLRGRGL